MSIACTPPTLTSGNNLQDPTITVELQNAMLLVHVTHSAHLYEEPIEIVFESSSGASCSLLPGKLGSGAWIQELTSSDPCETTFTYKVPFGAEVAQSCWNRQDLPTSTFFSTEMTVLQKGKGEHTQITLAPNKRNTENMFDVSHQTKRNIELTIDTVFEKNSGAMSTVPGGIR